MFKNEEIIEFLTRIIKNSNGNNIAESKESIEKFKEYLVLTTMCDEKTVKSITVVASCFEDLVSIYQKTGICDLAAIFTSNENIVEANVEKQEKKKVRVKKRTFDKPYQEKHYDRYVSTSSDYGSSCGSSSKDYYGSSCYSDDSYGSHC